MNKRKKVKLADVKAAKNIRLGWKVRRQVQQAILQKKLAQLFLKPCERHAYIERYPEAMQPMIKDFMREAERQTRLQSKTV
jgi:hypothetical protein